MINQNNKFLERHLNTASLDSTHGVFLGLCLPARDIRGRGYLLPPLILDYEVS
jgi:hypothetical protein